MDILRHIAIGFGFSFLGSLPLGMLNLSALDLAVRKGLRSAAFFSLGVIIVEYFQAMIAIVFSTWITSHPDVVSFVEGFVIFLFLFLGFYYIRKARMQGDGVSTEIVSHPFRRGLMLSALNPLAIPFWVFYTGFFYAQGWADRGLVNGLILSLGIIAGTYAALLGYSWAGNRLLGRISGIRKRIDLIVGIVFLGLAIFQAIISLRG